jgi:uncharacterized protein with FMN-binding domain/NAD-dependent dihydropyrimidine dehydrogenase PreA subunit
MKKIQIYRLGVQLLCLVMTVVGIFLNFKTTILAIMGLTLLSGAFYCGWICPYGFIQDLSSKLGQVLGIKKRKMPNGIHKVLLFSRYILLGLVMLISTDFIFSIMSFDPKENFGSLLGGNVVAIGALGVLSFFVIISLFFDRPFCNYLCYEGAKYGLLSSLRLLTIKRNEVKCVNCKKCDKACPMNIEVSKCSNLRSPQCINCFQCVSSCPVKGALNYGKVNMSKSEKKRYFTILAGSLVLISGFIVYNIFNGSNPLNSNNNYSVNAANGTVATETLPKASEESTVTNGDSSESLAQDTEKTAEDTESVSKDTENKSEDTIKSGEAAGITDGVYTGEGKGFRGTITVEVTVKDQGILSVEVVEHREDQRWFNRANNAIPSSIIESQSTDVDLVSGATYSSIGIRDAVKDALEKAK